MEERFRFVEEWNSGDWNIAELCRFYEIARGTGYKWIGRFEAGGIEALRDLSRAPHVHPSAVSQEIEDVSSFLDQLGTSVECFAWPENMNEALAKLRQSWAHAAT